ncbi:ribonuclease P protein component [Candidatus Thioglobus sp.]|jgi:ribonuclease P protein component|uniref:ribonuclease P protein component n=1 Tax=Candidatus Thioglobus sp. TaxID=2026721 RepID=UPI001D7DCA33|nr:ribonuclease P protein component [Candidatus Thioglobus sp.]MBT3276869.1 ribonuclease P protein component [Candidatus Thioglobus sp.]MBT3447545.1 ribonuclease P protein component [Candidatus Thioglobus sp.]MBT4000512.1 ribonuclease P protein component [Candidatus Thioglobus sp.]MBT4182017.1 ribonuclease P protein component [Candidatus Thioglobus sp.]MBT4422209.1 ribonuclease P protein component [Candidatus Thioglobus sp.]
MSFRLTRQSKVLKPSEYKSIFNNGKMTRGKYWQVMSIKTDDSRAKLGLAISKKVHRLAVERNRFKRLARETFRLNQAQLNNWEFVVMAKHAKPASNAAIAEDLLSLFNQVVAK